MPPVGIAPLPPLPEDQLYHALQDARAEGAVEEVRYILVEGLHTNPQWLDPVFEMAQALRQGLRLAAEVGDLERVRSLLGHWRADPLGMPPLSVEVCEDALVAAVENRYVDVVRYLLNNWGAEITPRVIRSPANFRRVQDNDAEVTGAILQAFLDHGWKIDSRSDTGAPLICYATNNPAILTWLLEHGADPNARDKSGQTPLAHAASCANSEAIELLFHYGARIDNNALHRVIRRRRGHGSHSEKIPILQCLLKHGADINARENRLERPHILALRRFHKANTPLHEALERGDQGVIQFLLEKGAKMELE